MAIEQETGNAVEPEAQRQARVLHVRVTDHAREGHPTVNVKLPIGVVRWGMKLGAAFSPQMKDANLDWDVIATAIEQGEVGKIVEVEDEAEHKTVEVWVE
jgi:hypothetical protein